MGKNSISQPPQVARGKESNGQCRSHRFYSWVKKIPWRRKGQPILVFLPEKSHGLRSLVGHSPWGYRQLDMAGWLSVDMLAMWMVVWVPWPVRDQPKSFGGTLRKSSIHGANSANNCFSFFCHFFLQDTEIKGGIQGPNWNCKEIWRVDSAIKDVWETVWVRTEDCCIRPGPQHYNF